ncbi:MAG: VanW family protein [Acetatifactor sp.]|nr:VanW family protein [Acetatifactor sp.]
MKTKKIIRVLASFVLCVVLAAGAFPMEAQAAKYSKTDLNYISQVFDAEYYYNTYEDVAKALGNNPSKLLDHYVTHGIREGRNASATFNFSVYKGNYADLKKAFGSNKVSYFRHYIEHGMAEGRNAIDWLVEPPVKGNVIASYTTQYDAKIGRATNVQLAASQIDGMVLEAGETFSFLGSITPRTLENGYVMATVFSGGKKSKGIGGGICQVSSTIYAAILGTDCEIVERHSHSLPVSYVPKGMDATVSAPSLDFRFTNTYNQPMMLSVTAEDGVLTVDISLQ